MVKNIFIFSAILLINQFLYSQQTINASSSKVNFEISNMGFKTVEGSFSGMSGTVNFQPSNLNNSTLEVCIDAKTVDTDNETRDEHLSKEDFFYVEKYPSICFKSTSISKSETGYLAKGTLTMRGVSKEVSIPFTYSNNTFNGSLEIDRTNYKVGSDGGFMVGKTVQLTIICALN